MSDVQGTPERQRVHAFLERLGKSGDVKIVVKAGLAQSLVLTALGLVDNVKLCDANRKWKFADTELNEAFRGLPENPINTDD